MACSSLIAPIRWLRLAVVACFVGMLCLASSVQAQVSDPETVFNSFHAAVNAHDVDAALALFADDGVVQFPNQPPPNIFRGKTEIRTWLQGDADQHIQVKTEQLKVAGDKLTWIAKVDVDELRGAGITIEGPAEAVIQDGKIKSFSFTLSQDTLAKLAAVSSQPQSLPATGAAVNYSLILLLMGVAILGLGAALRLRRPEAP